MGKIERCPRAEKPRTVKPRREFQNVYKPIIAIHGDEIFIERTGEITSIDNLTAVIVREPSSLVACHNAGVTLQKLDRELEGNPRWQFRITPVEREIFGPDRETKGFIVKNSVVAFFGFARQNGNDKSKYHYPIDPLVLCRRTAKEIVKDAPDTLTALVEWAKDIRTFCTENRLAIKATSGGIAAQLLRDKRFYPEARRKVPRATNDKVREHLPGNHYRLHAEPRSNFDAFYLDQKSAHHSCAASCSLPDANSLYARGYFRSVDDRRTWAKPGTPLYNRTIRMFGLFKLKIAVPAIRAERFPLPYMLEQGHHIVYAYSNEIADIERMGGRIEGIIAAWASPDADKGIQKYAEWSLRQSAKADDTRKAWLKPVLLSAYGVLASRPKQITFGFKRSNGGTDAEYPCGSGRIKVREKRVGRESEPSIANVIHRGIVEAETRLRSLRLARYISEGGGTVLSVYADSVFVDASTPLPLLDDRWKVQAELTHLQFLNPVQFVSRELTKLPGVVTKEDNGRLSRRLSMSPEAIKNGREKRLAGRYRE